MDDKFYIEKEWSPQSVRGHINYLLPYLHCVTRAMEDPKWNIVEMGIGSGWPSIFLSKFYSNVYGVDINVDVLEMTKKLARKMESNLRIVWGDTFDLSRLSASIGLDIIHHQGLLEHFAEEEIVFVLNEQTRVARQVIGCVPTDRYIMDEYEKGFDPNQHMWPAEQWLDILRNFVICEHGVFGLDQWKEQLYFRIRKREE